MPDIEENTKDKLAKLLRELFQFDMADLDFGIYRIMNYKRAEIEKFIEKDLIEKTNEVFKRHAESSAEVLKTELSELRSEINTDFGMGTIDEKGVVRKHQDAPKVKEYVRKQEALRIAEHEVSEVYNHIYEFFSRYYDKGDFYSKRRIGGREKYVIPYNGEEVMLHWANNDQYYIKTSENFTNYEFDAGAWHIHFEIVHAEVEQGNVKGDKRYFVLASEKPVEPNKEKKELRILFQYRGLTEDEEKAFAKRNVQEDIIRKVIDKVFEEIAGSDVVTLLKKEEKSKDGDETKTLFEKHLSRYVKRNTMDYFIHKNLKGFLTQELEFYLKSEVLRLEEVAGMNETALRQKLNLINTMKEIATTIIEFLAQIEGFQKKLWEKKKFVLKTDYCMTLDRVPKEFYAEIAKNKEQVTEWKRLFALDEVTKGALDRTKDKEILDAAFLESHQNLVLDTKFFKQEFKDRLLATVENIDEAIGGLMIKSENWQGLDILQERYREQIGCTYIDPPYNAKSSEILYKNNYKHSSWLCLMYDRILLGKRLLSKDFVHIVAIDEVEQEVLGRIISNVFLDFAKVCISIVHNPRGQQGKNVSYVNDFAYFTYPGDEEKFIADVKRNEVDSRNLRDSGTESDRTDAKTCFYPFIVKDSKIIDIGDVPENDFHPTSANIERTDGTVEIWPIDESGDEKKWRYSVNTVKDIFDKLEVKQGRSSLQIIFNKDTGTLRTVWADPRYDASEYGTKVLQSLFGEAATSLFSYPKSLHTVKDSIYAGLNDVRKGLVLDYFAGSGTTGHAVLGLNTEYNSEHKYILIEMAHYFDTIMKPRIQKVMFSKEWKDCRPISNEGYSHIFKYMYLEQYEDTLNNIVFKEPDKTMQQTLETFKDYFIRYMLDYETRGSPARMALKEFEDPFNYKLWIEKNGMKSQQTVDLVETFNYLLGLTVEKMLAKKDRDRYYRIVKGKKRDDQTVLVIWRSTKDLDLKKDKQFIAQNFLKDFKPDILYVNGQCLVKDAKSIEPDFKELMGA